jgi:hypothetical protein
MVGGWAIEIISLMDGVSPLFRPAIVALLFLLCWCMTQASKPMASMHACARGYRFFTFTISLSIMVTLHFKIGSGDMLAT